MLTPRFDLHGERKGTWTCKGSESGTPFDSVEFDDGVEWMDYDEKVSTQPTRTA